MTDIKALREKIAAADPLPWSYDSYSTVASLPMLGSEDAYQGEDEAELERLDSVVARVQILAGDTATVRGSRNAQAIESGMNALPALLDELEGLRSEAASESRWAEQYKRERDAMAVKLDQANGYLENFRERDKVMVAKLEKVRGWASKESVTGMHFDWEVRRALLAILDAEPPPPKSEPTAAEEANARMNGMWRCQDCGEAVVHDGRWRWAGDRWQHHHGYPIGHIDATYFGDEIHEPTATVQSPAEGEQ